MASPARSVLVGSDPQSSPPPKSASASSAPTLQAQENGVSETTPEGIDLVEVARCCWIVSAFMLNVTVVTRTLVLYMGGGFIKDKYGLADPNYDQWGSPVLPWTLYVGIPVLVVAIVASRIVLLTYEAWWKYLVGQLALVGVAIAATCIVAGTISQTGEGSELGTEVGFLIKGTVCVGAIFANIKIAQMWDNMAQQAWFNRNRQTIYGPASQPARPEPIDNILD